MNFNKDNHLLNDKSEQKNVDKLSSSGICCVHSKRTVFLVAAAAVALATAVAFFVVAGMFGAQQTHLKHLQEENELLKFQNEALNNEATACQSRASDSASELQRIKHLLDLSDKKCNLEKTDISSQVETRCNLEKANISNVIETRCNLEKTNVSHHLLAEFGALKAEKQTLERDLLECQEQVKVLMDSTSRADAQNATLRRELDRCDREKEELLVRVSEPANHVTQSVTCQPCPSPIVYDRNDGKGPPTAVCPSSSGINRSSFALFAFLLLSSFHSHG